MEKVRMMTRRTVLYPTMLCNLKCPFCYYRYLQKSTHRDFEDLKKIVDSWKNYYIDSVDITGGEPTIFPKIVDLVKYIKERKYKTTIITNATLPGLIPKLAEAGLDEFLISIHGYPELHETMVDAKTWPRVKNFLKTSEDYDIPFRINCVVTKVNYKGLEKTAKFFLNLNTKIVNFIVFNPHPGTLWSDKINIPHQESYSKMSTEIKKAIDILDKDIWVNVRYIPICTMKDYEEHVTNFIQSMYEPYEWECLSQFGITKEKVKELAPSLRGKVFGTWDLEIVMNYFRRRDIQKNIWSKKCWSCSNRFICDGIYPQYYKRFTDKEFIPYKGEVKIDPITYRLKDLRWLE